MGVMSRSADFNKATTKSCPNCGGEVSGDGWELSAPYDNGARYRRQFHTKEVCAIRQVDRDSNVEQHRLYEENEAAKVTANQQGAEHAGLVKEALDGGHIQNEEAMTLLQDHMMDQIDAGQARQAKYESDVKTVRETAEAKKAPLWEAKKKADAAYRARKKAKS